VWAGVVWEQDDPAKGTFRKVKPVANVAAKCLLQSEVEKMYEVAYPDARDYAMIMVLSTTGVRINEMVKMKWSEMFQSVDENTKKLEWYISVIGKGGKLRDCWIREDAAIALVRLNGREIDTTREGYIFTSFYRQVYGKMSVDGARKAIKDIADRAGIKEEFTPHWFRHTFGTLTANNGAPIRELQANKGHAELKTTEKYLWSQNTKVAKYYPATFTPTEDRKHV